MARPLSWLVVAGLAGAALVGPAGASAAGNDAGAPDYVPNSGHTSSSGLTLTMGTAAIHCEADWVASFTGSFEFTGTGHVVLYLAANNGSNATPAGAVQNNEITIDLTGQTSPITFTLPITSAFQETQGGVLVVFASDQANVKTYSSKSNSLNCEESTTTTTTDETTSTTDQTTSTSDETTSTSDQTTSTSDQTTSTSDQTTSTSDETTSTSDQTTTTSSVESTTTTQDTTTTTADTTTSSVASTSSAQTTEPAGEVEGVEGTPRVTLPPTSTLDAATPAGNPDGLRIALLGLAVLLASILLLQPKGSRSRK